MKSHIQALIEQALTHCEQAGHFSLTNPPNVQVEHARNKAHGDFASNIAMVICKQVGMPPREVAERLVDAMPASDNIEAVTIAGPGFINFKLAQTAHFEVVNTILDAGGDYGVATSGAGKKIILEFVSANPTGPLHVGHGRGAAHGATVANIWRAVGYQVHNEYYVNDAGRQMDILATSVWLRYLSLCSETIPFPSNGYRGDYISEIAQPIFDDYRDAYYHDGETVMRGVPADEPNGGDKEAHIDGLVQSCKHLLGEDYNIFHSRALESILGDIKNDLSEFGVHYDEWHSEKRMVEQGAVEDALEELDKRGYLYEREGARWFRASSFGDEKDRVVVRANGQYTYFATDIAYHWEKFERGFDRVVDVFGADHHGYIARIKAALTAYDKNADDFDVMLVQFASLYRGGEKVQMSTRSGSFVTLRELREDVGVDAARFFYIMRKKEQHLDFDLDLAKSQSNENPVYYIQYAHARICSVLRQMTEQQITWSRETGSAHLSKLSSEYESDLMARLARYPEVVLASAKHGEPHLIAHYLRELAGDFHAYYNAEKFLVDDQGLRQARLNLIVATQTVLQNGLKILGVSAPEKM